MKRIKPISFFCILQLIILTGFQSLDSFAGDPVQQKPNIVFLFTDDQKANTIHALGNPFAVTPHIDQLAESGVSITNAYCQGSFSSAVCLASRTMLITGQNWHRVERDENKDFIHPENLLLPEAFQNAGYFTGGILKKGPSPKNLEKSYGYVHLLDDSQDRLGGFSGKEPVDEAIKFLEQHAGRIENKEPFFLYVCFPGPHDERFADQKYLDLFPELSPLPDNFRPFYPYANGFSHFGRDNCLVGFPRTEKEIQTELHHYYGMIASIDENIGRLMNRLKEMGQFKNTIFVYSSDHSFCGNSNISVGKQNLYEDAMKAPLILSGPGIERGRTSGAMGYLHDIFPTLCDLAGVDIPDNLHAESFAPVLHTFEV